MKIKINLHSQREKLCQTLKAFNLFLNNKFLAFKLIEFTDNNFELDENRRQFS